MNFRKKPVEVEALHFLTNNESDSRQMDKIVAWMNRGQPKEARHGWHNGTDIFIETLEGTMTASVGDWVIKGVKGEFYPCKPDIFNESYEPIQ